MLYRAELWSKGTPLIAINFTRASAGGRVTHPQQAVRRMMNAVKQRNLNMEFGELYVMNDEGQVWKYQVTRLDDTDSYSADKVFKENVLLPRNVRNAIFSGNTTIREVARI